MNWYLHTLKQYAVFKGRACRREFVFFVLFQIVIFFILSMIERSTSISNPETMFGVLSTVFFVFTLLPALAVSARRLHDINASAWWLLIYLIPFLGWVMVLVLMIVKGTAGKNQYGDESSLIKEKRINSLLN